MCIRDSALSDPGNFTLFHDDVPQEQSLPGAIRRIREFFEAGEPELEEVVLDHPSFEELVAVAEHVSGGHEMCIRDRWRPETADCSRAASATP